MSEIPTEPPPPGPRKNFFQVSNRVIDDYGAQMGSYGIAVYAVLARHANREGYCWPSHRRVKQLTGISRRKIVEVIQELETLRLITVEPRTNEAGDATSNMYYLPFHRLTKP